LTSEQKQLLDYQILTMAGRELVRKYCFERKITPAVLAARSGIEQKLISQILLNNHVQLPGKAWDRLTGLLGISYVEWVQNAISYLALDPDKSNSTMLPVDCLHEMSSFYLEASRRANSVESSSESFHNARYSMGLVPSLLDGPMTREA
jgi:hypothetical protein